VSSAAQVSLGYLSEVERGQKEASSELLASICRALGVRLSDVLRDVSESLSALEPEPAPVPVPTPSRPTVPRSSRSGRRPTASLRLAVRDVRDVVGRCLKDSQRAGPRARVGGEQQPVGDQGAGQQEEQRLLERQAEQQHPVELAGVMPRSVGERQAVGGAQPQRARQRDDQARAAPGAQQVAGDRALQGHRRPDPQQAAGRGSAAARRPGASAMPTAVTATHRRRLPGAPTGPGRRGSAAG
jgi:hypothetical protein